LADHRGRLEVRLAQLEMHDIDARALERLRPLPHLHREERLDLSDPPREAHRRLPARSLAVTICQNIPGPCRSTPTLLPGWSAQFTGTSTTRYPAACAERSSSTSKPKPRVRSPPKRRSAAAALKTLNPHCESATDRRPSRATSQLKTRPAATRCGSAATDTDGSARTREPITTSAPARSAGSSRLTSAIGVAPSASVNNREAPRAASMPVRTAEPFPAFTVSRRSRTDASARTHA